MSLCYLVKLDMLTVQMLPPSCYRKKLQNLSHLNFGFQIRHPVDNSMWEILQENMYKTCITDLDLSLTPLTNGCCNDDMTLLGPLCSQLLFQLHPDQ